MGSEICKRSSPGAECPCLELQSPCRLLLVDRSLALRPCRAFSPSSGLRSRHSIIFLLCRHIPDHAGHLVRQRNGCNHLRFARHECGQPAVLAAALADHPADHAHGANDQEPTDIGLAHFADRPQPGLAAGGPLSWHKPEPCREVAPAVENVEVWRKGRHGTSGDGADPRNCAKSTQTAICLRCRLQLVCHAGRSRGRDRKAPSLLRTTPDLRVRSRN